MVNGQRTCHRSGQVSPSAARIRSIAHVPTRWRASDPGPDRTSVISDSQVGTSDLSRGIGQYRRTCRYGRRAAISASKFAPGR
jgi:hypothetical protein